MRWLALALLSSCTTFEDPTLVIDLRVIAITATPPEQVIDIDLENPPQLADLIDQLKPTFVCATVADPRRFADLQWSMTACLTDNGRCDPEVVSFEIGSGVVSDPDASGAPVCALVEPSSSLIGLLNEALEADTFRGLSGLTYTIELRVGEAAGNPDEDQFASKNLHVFARFPEDRVANHNPVLDEIQLTVLGDPVPHVPPLFACGDDRTPFTVPSRSQFDLLPIEAPDTREIYPVLRTDGTFERFDETLTYQYLSTGGSVQEEFGGGPRDFLGNLPRLGTTWDAPEVERTTDIQLWINQRDERGGAAVYPLCIRVSP